MVERGGGRADVGLRSRSGTTTSGNSRPLAWWIVIRRITSAASGSVAASASFGWRAMNSASCVMKPSRSSDAAVIGGAGLLDELVQVGELALAEKLGEQHGVVAGAGERFAAAASRSGRESLTRAEMAERVGGRGDFARVLRPRVAAAAARRTGRR